MVSQAYILGLAETLEAQRGEVICPGSHSKELGLYSLMHRLTPHHPRPRHGELGWVLLISSFPTGGRAQGVPAVATSVSVMVGLGFAPWSV